MATNTLSDLVEEHLSSLRTNGYAPTTIRNTSRVARSFLAHVGNVQARSLSARHVDSYFAARQTSLAPTTLNNELACLRSLFKFGVQRRYLPAGFDPTAHRRRYRTLKRDRLRVPASSFGALLDCAEHPRDRIIVALGLFLFLRQSEMKGIQMKDVDLQGGHIAVLVTKSDLYDEMPISAELDRELRRWLVTYQAMAGRPLGPDDYLTPRRSKTQFAKGFTVDENRARVRNREDGVVPHKPVHRPEAAVQRALIRFGQDVRGEDGRSMGEGVHTLRRSGARALFDRLVEDGYDGALKTVQAMLHHAQGSTTEVYLGIKLDKKRRDGLLRGKPMFPAMADKNVIDLGVRREA